MQQRPVIGLTAYREEARWGVWQTQADVLPTVYSWAIEEAGGVPVLLPASTPARESAATLLDRLDGLVISGGADVSPARYQEEPHQRTTTWREDRDEWELGLVEAADHVQAPTLGVCRGMQVMAVAAGGKLDQHLPDLVGHEQHNPGEDRFGSTSVHVEPGTLLHSLVGRSLTEDHFDVHCHHHQGVRSHPGFDATAWAGDGTLEAMERPGERFCLAVQWHPEMAVDAGLFSGLIRAATKRRRSGRP